MKNIAIGGFFHESNTFNPIITSAEEFLVFEGDSIFANRDSFLLAKGIIEYFERITDYKLLPLVFAKAVPNGEIDQAYYLYLKDRFLEYLAEVPRIDAFVLALHGSMRVQGIGSAETDLLRSISELYPGVPIFCGLDMHATLTQEMLSLANAYVGFKTAPHLDAYETGLKAAEMADISLSSGTPLTMGFAKIDFLIAGEKSETDCEPMRSLIAELYHVEENEDVCSASYLLGFPWADAKENGVTALVVTKNDSAKAKGYAEHLAEEFRKHQTEFGFSSPAYPPEEALMLALRESCKPVFVSDSGDNPTAGSTGDNTTIISLLSNELSSLTLGKKVLVAGIYDPIAVKICRQNMQRKISLELGGVYDTMFCKPIEITGTPLLLVENFGLFRSDLILFRTDVFDLIITSQHIGFTNVDMFRALDIDYLNKDVIVVKLGYLTEDFKPIAAKSYLALTRGCSDEVLSRLNYSKVYDLI